MARTARVDPTIVLPNVPLRLVTALVLGLSVQASAQVTCKSPTDAAIGAVNRFLESSTVRPWLIAHGIAATSVADLRALSDTSDLTRCQQLTPQRPSLPPAYLFASGAYVIVASPRGLMRDSVGVIHMREGQPDVFVYDAANAMVFFDGFDQAGKPQALGARSSDEPVASRQATDQLVQRVGAIHGFFGDSRSGVFAFVPDSKEDQRALDSLGALNARVVPALIECESSIDKGGARFNAAQLSVGTMCSFILLRTSWAQWQQTDHNVDCDPQMLDYHRRVTEAEQVRMRGCWRAVAHRAGFGAVRP